MVITILVTTVAFIAFSEASFKLTLSFVEPPSSSIED